MGANRGGEGEGSDGGMGGTSTLSTVMRLMWDLNSAHPSKILFDTI